MLKCGALNSLKLRDPISLAKSWVSLRAKLTHKRDGPLGWRFCGVFQCTSLVEDFLRLVGDLMSIQHVL